MHHPGPPRFCTVGERVELAPRDPDPSASFSWRLIESPAESTATVGGGPVSHLTPDAPGTYRAECSAPDGPHTQTVRAFPAAAEETVRFSVTADDAEGDGSLDGDEDAVVMGRFNDFTMGTQYATRDGDEWVFETSLPPGEHEAIFAFEGEFEPYASDTVTVDGPGRPRIRLDGRREGDELVVTATARAAPERRESASEGSGGAPANNAPHVEFHLDDRDALAESAVEVDGDELRAPVDALPEQSRIHAVAVAERASIADALTVHAAGSKDGGSGDGDRGEDPQLRFERPADPPDWVRDATIYEIFVREFAGETVDATFPEIERRVPYLESLGVDVVWFTPVVAGPTRHGYHSTDLFDTAADLGTRAEFESLVERCHEADVRVVFDLVINHTSRDHPNFQLHRAGVPEFADHYERIPTERDTTDVDWAGDDAPGHYFNWTMIPNVNYDSLAVRRWMLDVIDEWAPVVDGFRCDVAWGVPHGFWKEARERLKGRDTDFLLLDETVPRHPADAAYHENEFDVHYDADLYAALREIGRGEAPATAVLDALEAPVRMGYPDEAAHMRYVENHDEDRYSQECGDDALRAAVGATFTLPGVPMIYYGQERGVEDSRGTMRWHDGDADLTDFHRRLVALRGDHPALRAPGVEAVDFEVSTGDADGVVAYERANDDERLVVVLNFDGEAATIEVERAVETFDLVSETDLADDDGLRVTDVAVLRVAE